MNKEKLKALYSMGYRKAPSSREVYAKPIGLSIFVFANDRLYQYFKGANSKMLCMQSWGIGEDPLREIKEAENYHHQVADLGSAFEFLTPEQAIELEFQDE